MDSSSMHRCTCRGLTKSIGLQYSCSSNITLKTESVPEMPSGPDEAPRTDAPCHTWPGKRKVELEWGFKHRWKTRRCPARAVSLFWQQKMLTLRKLVWNVWKASHPFSSGQTNVTSPLCLKPRSSAVEMLQKMQIERCWVKVVATVATCNKRVFPRFRPPKTMQSYCSFFKKEQASSRQWKNSQLQWKPKQSRHQATGSVALGCLVFESRSLYQHFGYARGLSNATQSTSNAEEERVKP